MADELDELLDSAIYKEIASQALYEAAQSKTQDPGVEALLKELAREEHGHAQWLKKFKEKGLPERGGVQNTAPNLMISEYLTGGDTLAEAGLQETLIFAMKREQQAVEFYSKMMSLLRDEAAKNLCAKLVNEELKHKMRLEMFYDDLFYRGAARYSE